MAIDLARSVQRPPTEGVGVRNESATDVQS